MPTAKASKSRGPVLVTGGSGFVGSAVLRLLLQEGHAVRALLRSGSVQTNVDGLDITRVQGDLNDPDSLTRAVQGCKALYHVAADYRLWTPRPKIMYRTNVIGTRTLMLAALKAGVERIVYTSSVATLGVCGDGTPANEDIPASIDDMKGHYKQSKFLAEQEVLKLVREEGLPAVVVNPSTPMGPRDIKPTPTGQIILDAVQGRMPAYVDTGLNIVHVDDVARGHLLAMEQGKVGERYILGGDNMSLRTILHVVSALAGRKPPRLCLPHTLILPVAWCMEQIGRGTGMTPRATVDAVRMAKKHMYFDSQKAESELAYRHRGGRETLRDATRWFMECLKQRPVQW